MTQRDTYRAKLYGAEDHVARMLDRTAGSSQSAATIDFFGSSLTLPVERRFGDVASVQRYADRVLALDRVRRRWGDLPPVSVRERAGQRAAHYELPGVVAVPTRQRWALREIVICHELAHHVALHTAENREAARHGEEFAGVYATLVGMIIGPEVELLLRAAFNECGVPTAQGSGPPGASGSRGPAGYESTAATLRGTR